MKQRLTVAADFVWKLQNLELSVPSDGVGTVGLFGLLVFFFLWLIFLQTILVFDVFIQPFSFQKLWGLAGFRTGELDSRNFCFEAAGLILTQPANARCAPVPNKPGRMGGCLHPGL